MPNIKVSLAVLALFMGLVSSEPDPPAPPAIALSWNYDSSTAVEVTTYDQSTNETEFRIYRFSGLSLPYHEVGRIASDTPANNDTLCFYDPGIQSNTWYRYTAAAFKPDDSNFSPPCTVFTFRSCTPRRLVRFTKRSDFPIAEAGWSALAGDSIIFRDGTSPAGRFSVIDMSHPDVPRLTGFIDSAALLAYPQQTLIPASLKYGIANRYAADGAKIAGFGNSIVLLRDSTLLLFAIGNGSPVLLDSIRCFGASGILPLNDSNFAVFYSLVNNFPRQRYRPTGTLISYYILPIRIASNGFIRDTAFQVGYYRNNETGIQSYNPFVRGIRNGTIVTGVAWRTESFGGNSTGRYCICYKSGISPKQINGAVSRSFTANFGYYLSPTLFLSPDTTRIYAEEIGDLDGYQTAIENDAVLPDSFQHRRNVLIDTARKLLYIVYSNNISTFGYSFADIGTVRNPIRSPERTGLRVLPGPGRAVTIQLPKAARSGELSFYDLAGKLVGRVSIVNANEAVWSPRRRGAACYIVSGTFGDERYTTRFMVR